MPFAIMRNVHEALRTSVNAMNAMVAAGPSKRDELRAEWAAFQRALAVHMVMEDEGMFPLLNEMFDNVCTSAHLDDEHTKGTGAVLSCCCVG